MFRKGAAGQKKIVEYFFQDSPVDAVKLANPEIFETTRDNIAFSFRDPQQVVRDIALWSSEWGDDLNEVSARLPVTFIHGAEHSFFPLSAINALAQHTPSLRVEAIPNSAQLALYEAPERVAGALLGLLSRHQTAGAGV